jgi:hypothetical protein
MIVMTRARFAGSSGNGILILSSIIFRLCHGGPPSPREAGGAVAVRL